MSDKITTLHLKNDPSTNIYPNVKIENIPLDVTISSDGENLAKTKTIYEFTTSKFLSLDGGTMRGNIMTGGFARPEEVVLGDGLDVSDLSSPAEPVTHYGSGYIRQDDDEDTSVKYEYNFPKKSGTFALGEDLENYAKKEDFEELKSLVYSIHSLIYNAYEFANLTTSAIPNEVDSRKVIGGSYAIIGWIGGNSITSDDEIKSTLLTKIESWGYNLFDEVLESGGISTTTGVNEENLNVIRTKNAFEVIGGKSYKIETTDDYNAIRIFEYDKNNNFLSTSVAFDTSVIYTFASNVSFVRFVFANNTIPSNPQIAFHLTSAGSGYKPYVGKLGEIAIPNAPLKLDGFNDIHDTLTFEEQENGTYNAILTKKIGVETPTTETIATGLSFDDTIFKIEKGGTIKAVYDEVPPTISVNFMTKGE